MENTISPDLASATSATRVTRCVQPDWGYFFMNRTTRVTQGVYNLIEDISNEPNKNCDQSINVSLNIYDFIISIIENTTIRNKIR
jgi:hypothetical protein